MKNAGNILKNRRALSAVVTTLIILVVSVLLAGVVTYFAINVVSTRVQEESLNLQYQHVWFSTTDQMAEAAVMITNTGGRDVVLDKITIRGQTVPTTDLFWFPVTTIGDLPYVSQKPNPIAGYLATPTTTYNTTTFGKTSKSGGTYNMTSSYIYADRYKATNTGNVTSISVSTNGAIQVQVSIYNDINGSPNALLGHGRGTTTNGAFAAINLTTKAPVTKGSYYWISVQPSGNLGITYDPSNSSVWSVNGTNTYGNYPSPFPTPNTGNYSMDIYATISHATTTIRTTGTLIPDAVGTNTPLGNGYFNSTTGSITLTSGSTIAIYMTQSSTFTPGSVTVNDVGLTIGISVFTAQATYYKETNVNAP
jgi:hypothetical protein